MGEVPLGKSTCRSGDCERFLERERDRERREGMANCEFRNFKATTEKFKLALGVCWSLFCKPFPTPTRINIYFRSNVHSKQTQAS